MRTIVQLLFLSSSLQGWLLGVGLGMTVLGISLSVELGLESAAMAALASVLTILGLVTTVAAPVVLDAVMFRSISAPHAVTLIPNGRLKLAVGALGAQLLLALFIGVVVGALLSLGSTAAASDPATTPITRMVSASLIAFTGITIYFLGFYWASQFKLGVLWFLACAFSPRLIILIVPPGRIHGLFTTASGSAALLAACLVTWLVFVISHARAHQVRPIYWGRRRSATLTERGVLTAPGALQPPVQYNRNQALRLLLLGSALALRTRTALQYVAAVLVLGAIVLVTAGRPAAFHWLPVVMVLGLIAAMIPGIHAGWFTLRARLLWLSSGLGREELFRKVEGQSWRMLWIIAGMALTIELAMLFFSARMAPAPTRLASILTLPLISGAAFIYVNLIGMPLRRLTYVLITVGSTTVILNESFFIVADHPPLALPLLLAFQVIMVPVLRAIARRRWQNMDWLINNPNRALFRVV